MVSAQEARRGGYLCGLQYETCNHREVEIIRSDLAVSRGICASAGSPAARRLVPEHRAEGPQDFEGQKDIAGSALTLLGPLDLRWQ